MRVCHGVSHRLVLLGVLCASTHCLGLQHLSILGLLYFSLWRALFGHFSGQLDLLHTASRCMAPRHTAPQYAVLCCLNLPCLGLWQTTALRLGRLRSAYYFLWDSVLQDTAIPQSCRYCCTTNNAHLVNVVWDCVA